MYAAAAGEIDVLKALVAAGANVNARETQGMTALMRAAQNEDAGVAQTLIAAKADLNMKDLDGNTAVICFVVTSKTIAGPTLDVLKLLIAAGADVNAKNNHGDTAWSSAKEGFDQMEPIRAVLKAAHAK